MEKVVAAQEQGAECNSTKQTEKRGKRAKSAPPPQRKKDRPPK
jgi:hypothetical protein